MQIIGNEIKSWNDSHRPLRSLTKEQLFKYPDADPSDSAYWDFSKEVIARRAAFDEMQREVEKTERDITGAQHRLNSAKSNLATAKEKLLTAPAKGELVLEIQSNLVESCKRAVKFGEDSLAKAVEANARMKRRMEQPAKEDSVISEEELQAFYIRKHVGDWNAILRSWTEGTLFASQRHGWGSFLAVRKKERDADAKAFWDANGIAVLVCQEKSPTFLAMHTFYQSRIAPPLHTRREFLVDQQADGGLNVAGLKPEAQRRYKRWNYAYNKATLDNSWADDSGVAYDERTFNPNDTGEERDDD